MIVLWPAFLETGRPEQVSGKRWVSPAEQVDVATIGEATMSHRIRFDADHRLFVIEVDGRISLNEFHEIMRSITSSTEAPPDTNALWDLRKLDFAPIDAEFWKGILTIRLRFPERGTARLAHVVSGEFAFGMLRMYEIYAGLNAQEAKQKIGVFGSIEEAQEWLAAGASEPDSFPAQGRQGCLE